MALAHIYAQQKKKMAIIESELKKAVDSEHSLIQTAATELLEAGGKRIRPVLTLLSAQFGDPDRREVIDAAVTLELIHMASLVHDDVVDNSDLRRGKPTVRAKWDDRLALFTGDFIFARAIERISYFDHPEAQRMISKVIRDLSLGEIDQIRDLGDSGQNLRCYLLRIKRKTALLIALSCQLGSLASGCSLKTSRILYYFGYFLGMSYQIIDDVLDFTSSNDQLGKPAGSDLRNGNMTLPTLYAMHQNPDIRRQVDFLLSDGKTKKSDADWNAVIESIRESGAIERSNRLSQLYLHKAVNILQKLPGRSEIKALTEVAEYMGKRKK